ncbi:hypothetical protein MU1_57700 [Paenibacillus glycanilyticus]|uniref:Uncharacterized protein n=1 Tax=Paenibacillus glycanilyticus TaxID=126569 RepID=A0ABQ6GME6_9BACL|nr:hypothetical protein MU1_57700 [Paenibacillus glycanilyticus]
MVSDIGTIVCFIALCGIKLLPILDQLCGAQVRCKNNNCLHHKPKPKTLDVSGFLSLHE